VRVLSSCLAVQDTARELGVVINSQLSLSAHVTVRDLRSFLIRFDFESYVRFDIRFVFMVRFEIFVIRKETISGS